MFERHNLYIIRRRLCARVLAALSNHVTRGAGWLNRLAVKMVRVRLVPRSAELGVSLKTVLCTLLPMYAPDVLRTALDLMHCTKRA